jgi:type I restriction enzyme S subunit
MRAKHKQTEVGYIPEDWEMFDLGEIINYTKGFAFKSSDYQSDGTRIVRVSDTTYDSITDENAVFIDQTKASAYGKWELKENDLIISTVGSKPPMWDSLVGKVIRVEKKYEGSLLNQNAVLIRAKNNKSYKQYILLNNLNTDRYIKFIESIFRGNANQASITLDELFKFQIALPNDVEEQRVIAKALSDVDKLIGVLGRLIAKKLLIKQGAMQELLTGKRRLPGFSGEWEVKKVCQFGEIVTGGTPPTNTKDYWGGYIPWVTPTDISTHKDIIETERQISTLGLSRLRKLPVNSVLVTCIASIGKNVILRRVGASNQQINAIIPNAENDSDFLYYLFEANIDYLKNNAGITATSIISKREFSELTFLVPRRKEQQAIATVLSDMDSEIVALEERLEKTKLMKQGMMQELLTGRIRLI